MANALLASAIVFVFIFVVFAMMIVYELTRRGVRINFFLLKLYLIKYIHQYGRITIEETGRIGPLYYPCIGSVNLALICAVLGLVLK